MAVCVYWVFFDFLNVMLCKSRVVSTNEDLLFRKPLMPSVPTQNKIVNDVLDDWSRSTYQGVLSCLNRTFSRYMHKCNFIHTHRKSTVLATPNVGELKSAYQNNVQIRYTEFQPKWKINVGSAGSSNSYTPLSKVHGLGFYESHDYWTKFYGYLYRCFSKSGKNCVKWEQSLE